MKQKQYQTENSMETKMLAEQLADQFKGGEVILLLGEIGAGKTTFVQGLAVALGVRQAVKSPTYNLIKVYPVHRKKLKKLIHVDAYRLSGDSASELELETAGRPDTITAIEWPQNLKFDLLNLKITHEIRLEHLSGDKRKIIIKTDRPFRIQQPFGPPGEHPYRYRKTGE